MRQRCESTSRRGLRCMKIARPACATCTWHAHSELLHRAVSQVTPDGALPVDPDLAALAPGVHARADTDRRFREIVGLPARDVAIVKLYGVVVDVVT